MAPIATLTVKLSAQIAEFQAEFREAQKTAVQFQQQFAGVVSTVGSLAKGLAVGIGVTGITNFIRDATNAASKIVDLSNKLGISTDAVQELDFVAGQTGTTIEALSRAMFTLGTNVAGGDKSAAAGVEKLGLSLAELKTLSPEDQFDKVVTAIGRMSSAQERNLALTQIFGSRTAQEIAKVAAEWETLSKVAPKAGEDQVRALNEAGNAADRAKKHFATLAIEGLGQIVIGAEAAEKKLFPLTEQLHRQLAESPGFIGWLAAYNLKLNETAAAASSAASALASIKPPNFPTQPGIGPAGNLGFGDLLKISRDLEQQQEAINKAAKASDAYADSVKQLRDQLSGTALQAEVRKLNDAFTDLNRTQTPSIAVLERVGAAAEDLRKRGATLTPQLAKQADASLEAAQGLEAIKRAVAGLDTIISDLGEALDPTLADAMRSVRGEVQAVEDRLEFFGELSEALLIPAMKSIREEVKSADERIGLLGDTFVDTSFDAGELARALSQLAQAGGPFAGLIQTLSTVVTAFDTADKSIKQFQAGLKAFNSGSILSGIAGITSGIAGLVTAAVAAGKALANLFDRNKGRDLVVAFAESFGGFDALHKRLLTLGEAGEGLWVRLTQGVGRNNPEQARAAIEAINQALGRQTDRLSNATTVLAEYGLSWEHAGQAFRNANLASQFDALHEKTLTLKEIGVDYNLILEKQASEYSKLVQAAIRTGTEIPIAMKPILEDLIRTGQLLREDGTAFDDLSDVSWSKTLTQGFKDVTTAIYDLRDALIGGVGGALDDLAKRRVVIPVRVEVEGVSGIPKTGVVVEDGGERLVGLASGGIVRRPTLALIGEAGPEAVIPLSSGVSPMSGSSTVILQQDGRAVAEVVVPHLPGIIRRYVLA